MESTTIDDYTITMVTLNDGLTWFQALTKSDENNEPEYWFDHSTGWSIMHEFVESHEDAEGVSIAQGDYDGLDDDFYWRTHPSEVFQTTSSLNIDGITHYSFEMDWSR